jgi:hypothetical protein
MAKKNSNLVPTEKEEARIAAGFGTTPVLQQSAASGLRTLCGC